MNINLHIERLVLDGLPVEPHQKSVVEQAVTSELTRLIREGGLSSSFTSGVAVPVITGSNIQLTGNPKPVDIGQQVARAVYGGIGK